MKILTNNQYDNFMGKINELVGEVVELENKLGLLKANYDANLNVIKELNGRIGGLTKENNRLKEQNEILVTSAKIKDKSNGELAKALSDYSEIIKERDSLNIKVKELEKKLEESLSDAYLRIKLPAVKAPNSQKMKVKSHAVKDRILKKYIDDLEKNG
jgi:chromosome segregation ATPase